MVRPWALSVPVLVLLICLPLMRPLRHPDPRGVSDDEQARLGTIQALVEQHTFDIKGTGFWATRSIITRNQHWYSDQPPMMSVLLSGPYWVMQTFGLTFDRNPVLTEYLLTLLGVTLPIAFAAGLLYRLGRIFELNRPARAALALIVVIGSGWISYATVLSAGAASAALVVMSIACLFQATLTRRRIGGFAWVFLGGVCVAVAATYDLTALAFVLLLLAFVVALRWSLRSRIGAVACYALGTSIPLLLHAGLNQTITGDARPGFLHPELRAQVVELPPQGSAITDLRWLDEDDEPPTLWRSALRSTGRFLAAFLGGHGLLTHFPVLIFGLAGVGMVMHRHWPGTTKALAAVSVAAALTIVIGYTALHADWKDAMFANRWFLVFLPLTLFWSGAWLRRPHHRLAWATAALLLGFSTVIALIGATDPQPRQGYDRYTAAGAFMHLLQPPQPPATTDMMADR